MNSIARREHIQKQVDLADIDGMRWLRSASEIGKITPWQFLALMRAGLTENYRCANGRDMECSVEESALSSWAECVRKALSDGVITTRDDVTGLPYKWGCAPNMDILDCWWSMSVSDAQKLVDSKGIAFNLKEAAEELYKLRYGATLAPAAKVEAAPVATPAPAAKVGTNKKKWDDTKLKTLWEESIMPGVTQTILAQKHGVKRQRISVLLAKAKDVHKGSNPSPYSMAGQLIQASKSKKR